MQVVHPHRAFLGHGQADVVEQRHHIREVDVAVTVKMRQHTASIPAAEIDCQDTSATLQDPDHLLRALLAGLPRQMVKHQRAQDDIESLIGTRQVLGSRHLEVNREAGLSRFSSSSCDHRRRGVDAAHDTGRPDTPCCRNRKRASSAAYVEHHLSSSETGEADDALTELSLSAVRQ